MLKFLSGEKKLPSKDQMLQDLYVQTQKIWKDRDPKCKTHHMIHSNRDYVNQLATAGEIESIPEVILAIGEDALSELLQRPATFRNFKYTVIDGSTFARKYVGE